MRFFDSLRYELEFGFISSKGSMPSLIRRLIAGGKRRARRDRRGQRTEALYDAALRLLATHDYERISIAAIAREAGCSVGAFYGRFLDKNAFLHAVISSAFRALMAESTHDLAKERWHESSRAETISGLVHHVVTQLSRDQAAGALRAAVKLATVRPAAAEPLVEYRAAVADRAVALLVPRPSPAGSVQAVRTAVQVVFATVIDATLESADPNHPGRRQMIEALTDLTTAYLRQAQKGSGAADSEAKPAEVRTPAPEPKTTTHRSSREPPSRDGLLRPEAKPLAKAADTTPRRGARPGATRPALKDPRDAKPSTTQETGLSTRSAGKRRYRLL